MTDKIESKGKTVQEAVNEALLQMGARKDEVRVEVLEEPRCSASWAASRPGFS